MRFSWDTETTLITDEEPIGDLVCLSWAVEGSSGLVLAEEGIALLTSCLEQPEIEIVGHNLPYDFRVAMKARPEIEPLIWQAYEDGRVFDTMYAAQLDDIARGIFRGSRKGAYTLQRLAVDYCSIELAKEDTYRLRYGELRGVPLDQWPAEAVKYPIDDAVTTLAVRNAMHEPPDTRAQSAHGFWLSLTGDHGILTDPDRVGLLFERVTTELAGIISELLPLGWISYDKKGDFHRHPSKVQARLVELGKAARKTEKGNVSVDEEACENSGDPHLKKYSRLSKLMNYLDKDFEYLSKPLVRCSYGLAETGRSTSWGTTKEGATVGRANMQNLRTGTVDD